jgi:hypothetical protein
LLCFDLSSAYCIHPFQDEDCTGSITDHHAIVCVATVSPCYSLWRHFTFLLEFVAPPQEVTDACGIVLSSFRINNGYLPSRLTLIVNQSQLTRHSVRGGTSQFLYFMTTRGGEVFDVCGGVMFMLLTLPCTVRCIIVGLEAMGISPYLPVLSTLASSFQDSGYYSYRVL